MSPTEDDLRSALSEGLGDLPDTSHIIAVAGERRARLHSRLRTGAAAAVLVAAVAGGSTWIATSGGGNSSDASSTAEGAVRAPQAVRSACPPVAPRTVAPRRGSPGTDGPLFAAPAMSMTVCAYPRTGSEATTPEAVVFDGQDAAALAASLEAADKTERAESCQAPGAPSRVIAILAHTALGKHLPTVTITLNQHPCDVVVSNGRAVRYGWTPPASLAAQLRALTADATSPHR